MKKPSSLTPSFLFPFMVLVILAGLSFWLERATEVHLVKDDGKTRHAPDTLVEDLTLYRHDANGLLQYKLAAPLLEHYPDDDSSLIQQPRLINYRPDGPEVVLTSEEALVTEQGKHILARNNVIITRAAFDRRGEMVARTPELTILPDEGRAFNQHPVDIREGQNWLKGVGVQIDNNKGVFSLQSRVTGEMFRNPPRK
ncbi:MAG: LPS export ABC transporter periplasmic protein LptC [Zoogloeaceae bacterium]|nr:LPS export ABC transporter periplasmic protein LptC [Zoogloeaceae bacterium]